MTRPCVFHPALLTAIAESGWFDLRQIHTFLRSKKLRASPRRSARVKQAGCRCTRRLESHGMTTEARSQPKRNQILLTAAERVGAPAQGGRRWRLPSNSPQLAESSGSARATRGCNHQTVGCISHLSILAGQDPGSQRHDAARARQSGSPPRRPWPRCTPP